MKTTVLDRVATPDDKNNLVAALTALVHREGQLNISLEELVLMEGGIGLRGRYEKDGSFTLWTYDVVEDLREITGK